MTEQKPLLSPKTDSIFKRIFGDERNKELLESFLKSVLNLPGEEFAELTILDPHSRVNRDNDKQVIMDVRARTVSGRHYDIEIQRASVPKFRERMVYYGARVLVESLDAGEGYGHLKQCASIRNLPELQLCAQVTC